MASLTSEKAPRLKSRIIIHGGAGNILHENLPKASYEQYRSALLDILQDAQHRLSLPDATALDVATFAVSQLENNALFNAGHGAVYTTAGTHELEASIMVSRGYRKRGVGVMGVTRVKNPIQLAREMLVRGEADDGGGARQHCQLHGETCDRLAADWGLELVKPSYYWTRRRWDEHRRGLGLPHDGETYEKAKRHADGDPHFAIGSGFHADTQRDRHDPSWNGWEYLPQGTVGAVVLDSTGTICVATSTGGLTNKLPGRIGDTPTLGAGFWAEEWQAATLGKADAVFGLSAWNTLTSTLRECFPGLSGYTSLPTSSSRPSQRAVAVSGTGNGDSFLRTNAARTACAVARFSPGLEKSAGSSIGFPSLQSAVTAVAGPNGILQDSAGDRWKVTGDGEGGMIGIDVVNGRGSVVADFNCGGMFRAWIDEHGAKRMAVFRNEGFPEV